MRDIQKMAVIPQVRIQKDNPLHVGAQGSALRRQRLEKQKTEVRDYLRVFLLAPLILRAIQNVTLHSSTSRERQPRHKLISRGLQKFAEIAKRIGQGG